MNNKQIVFSKLNTAELWDVEYTKPEAGQVVVETHFSTVSCGTEKANITGDPNVTGASSTVAPFPRRLGYSSSGIVAEVGEGVTSVKPGDRVIVFWGAHRKYNIVTEERVVKIEHDSVSLEEAALVFIASFSMAAIRKTNFEIGESAIVMGQGLLGQLAVKLLKTAGAVPIIVADTVEIRCKEGIANGADYAFNPMDENFAERVRELTSGGVNCAIEVTGVGAGFDSVLDCMAKFGRVALLGCTRDKNFTIDYYKKIHCPGITVVGAHTRARPDVESHHGYFTHRDDIKAILKLCAGGRLNLAEMIKETHKPEDCPEVYTRLINDKNFPVVVQFDWRNV